MSVQLIRDAAGIPTGFQARAHLVANRYLSAYFAIGKHGLRRSRALAVNASDELARKARRMKRRGVV